MKISDVILTAIVKKGFLYDAKNVDMEFQIPMSAIIDGEDVSNVVIKFKADHMSLKIEKSEA